VALSFVNILVDQIWLKATIFGLLIIRKPTCMLPMLDSKHASDRAFKMVCIVFFVGRLILLAQTHTNHTAS